MMNTISYGSNEHQHGDLYLPNVASPAIICLLHGGFWRMPYANEDLTPIALDLVNRGYAVWNLEYGRVGALGGGWPGAFQDIDKAIDHLTILREDGADIDLSRIVIVGHSAGGHLALWSAARQKAASQLNITAHIKPFAVIGLAPILDLERAYDLNLGKGAVENLLGGTPKEAQNYYVAASPMSLLPLNTRQLIIHAVNDEAVPIEMSRDYVKSALESGDRVDFIELPDGGHMDFIDPKSEAHAILCLWLSDLLA